MIDEARRSRARILVGSIIATVALYHLPGGRWVVLPLMWVSTFVHEVGHGLAAVAVGGRFEQFVMFADGSGMAQAAVPDSRIARALVSAGGLVGPAAGAAILFALARLQRGTRTALWVLVALLALSILMVVRNLFGLFFVSSLALLLGTIATRGSGETARFALVFFAVQLALSVFSRSDYLFARVANTGAGSSPSDVANMAEALFLPYWFWGALCGMVSVAVLAGGVWSYLRE